jgi:hypothetical protein
LINFSSDTPFLLALAFRTCALIFISIRAWNMPMKPAYVVLLYQ